MPSYDLRCEACGHRFEKFLTRLLRDSDKVCPECGSADVRPGLGGGVIAGPKQSGGACVPRGGFA